MKWICAITMTALAANPLFVSAKPGLPEYVEPGFKSFEVLSGAAASGRDLANEPAANRHRSQSRRPRRRSKGKPQVTLNPQPLPPSKVPRTKGQSNSKIKT